MRTVHKVLLVNGIQQHRHGALQHLVFEAGDAQRSRVPVPLADLYTTDSWIPVPARLEAIKQALEIPLQVTAWWVEAKGVSSLSSVTRRAVATILRSAAPSPAAAAMRRGWAAPARSLGVSNPGGDQDESSAFALRFFDPGGAELDSFALLRPDALEDLATDLLHAFLGQGAS